MRFAFTIILVLQVFLLFTQTNRMVIEKAKAFAYNKQYDSSISMLQQSKELDALQLLARVYAWNSQFDSSYRICNDLINDFPEVVTNYEIAATTALWGGKWSACYQFAEQGINVGGDQYIFKLLQLKSFIGEGEWELSLNLVNEMLELYSNKIELKQLRQLVKSNLFQKTITTSHSIDYFSIDSSRWRNTTLSLTNKTKYGPLIVSIHQAKRFNQVGTQTEIEFYPRIDSTYYAYLNLGYSPSILFPKNRHGASLFKIFPKGIEFEIGYRKMNFESNLNVWFYLGSLTKYFGSKSLSYRFTRIESQVGQSATHSLKLSHYFNDGISKISLEIGSGTNPRDYQTYNSFEVFTNINSRRLQLDVKKSIDYRTSLIGSIAYEKALYREEVYGNRYSINLGFAFEF